MADAGPAPSTVPPKPAPQDPAVVRRELTRLVHLHQTVEKATQQARLTVAAPIGIGCFSSLVALCPGSLLLMALFPGLSQPNEEPSPIPGAILLLLMVAGGIVAWFYARRLFVQKCEKNRSEAMQILHCAANECAVSFPAVVHAVGSTDRLLDKSSVLSALNTMAFTANPAEPHVATDGGPMRAGDVQHQFVQIAGTIRGGHYVGAIATSNEVRIVYGPQNFLVLDVLCFLPLPILLMASICFLPMIVAFLTFLALDITFVVMQTLENGRRREVWQAFLNMQLPQVDASRFVKCYSIQQTHVAAQPDALLIAGLRIVPDPAYGPTAVQSFVAFCHAQSQRL